MITSRRSFLRTLGLMSAGTAVHPLSLFASQRNETRSNHVWRSCVYIDEGFLEEIPLDIISGVLESCVEFYAGIGRPHGLPGVDLQFEEPRDARELQLNEASDRDIQILYTSSEFLRQLPVHLLAYGLTGDPDVAEASRTREEEVFESYQCGGLYHAHMATPTITINTCGVKCTTRDRTTSLALFFTCHEIGHSLGLAHVEDSNNLMSSRPFVNAVMDFSRMESRLSKGQVARIDAFFSDRIEARQTVVNPRLE